MPTPQRRYRPIVIQRLLDEPYRFQFVQAVRMLELWLRRNGVAHEDTLGAYLHFRNSLALSFPPSEIEALEAEAAEPIATEAALLAALRSGQLKRIHITPAFMGLLGLHGVLPYHYTESIANHTHVYKDEGPRAFLDGISSRALTLFYLAWDKYRVQSRVDANGGDGFLPLQLALAGVNLAPRAPAGKAVGKGSADLPDEVPAYYAAMLRHRPVSADVIAGVLTDYFCLPFTVEQFIPAWDRLPQKNRTTLGVRNYTLGQGFVLGPRCLRRDLRVRLRIGPLTRKDFDRFVPGGSDVPALRAMVALFAAANIEYEVRLVLRAEDVKPFRLCSDGMGGARLGLGMFMISKPETRPRDDIHYLLFR